MTSKRKRWPRATLGPFVDFLESMHPEGINEDAVGSLIGMSAQSISSMFMKDNARLSRVENIVRCYGMELRLIYIPEKPYLEGNNNLYNFPNAGNLYGIVEHCNRTNRTLNAIASEVGCKRDTIKHALDKGDIMLDILERITFAVGLRVKWTFLKIDSHS